MNIQLLLNHLDLLKPFLTEEGVSEVCINKPEEVLVEKNSLWEAHHIPELNYQKLKDIAHLTASYSHQVINSEQPLLSAQLPGGYRAQFILPPACKDNTIGLSIRVPQTVNMSWQDYRASGMFNDVTTDKSKKTTHQLEKYLESGDIESLLINAIKMKLNIIISGGTSTGKTTLLNTMLQTIPDRERIITIEDVPELKVNHYNSLSLFASKSQANTIKVDVQKLLEASLRIRPDRIILGELRGKEAFSFLRAINTGHPGSIATLHADTPKLALAQLALMVMQANLGLSRADIDEYVNTVIDLVIQIKRKDNGKRVISDVMFC